MEDNKYIDFFKDVKKFKELQKKQKQRGINDYNMVNVVRKENAEVGMHSNVIYSLIDPDGLHYQDDLFLNLFIEKVLEFNVENFGQIISVATEEQTEQNRRIDFTIKSYNYYIGIEMKVDAIDLNNQLLHYYKDLKSKAQNDKNQKVIIYYLTKDGKKASTDSSNGIEYRKVSFNKHILEWIEASQNEVRNITNLNEALENYKDIVKKITKSYKGNVMSLKDVLKEDKEKFALAKDICEEYENLSAELEKSFWEEVIELLKNENIKLSYVSNMDISNIKKARKLSNNNSEVSINIKLLTINEINDVILKVGSSGWAKGLFVTIAKLKNGKWVSGDKNYEEEIREAINKLDYIKFKNIRWAYGLSELTDYQLRNENLVNANDKINDLVIDIKKLKDDLTSSIDKALKKSNENG